ncbi:MAG: hypothetical protein KF898_09005 [Parachlamydiales bacterium]|nr:hypothetical protein [Candidatus Acheromyda pituitae]
MMQAISEAQVAQLGAINSWIASTFSLNPNDPIYNGLRDKTTLGLEVASLYAAAKGVVAFNKLAKAPGKISSLTTILNASKTETGASSSFNALRLKNRLISQEISKGHAFEKQVLNHGEYLGWIRTRTQFAEHVENVLNNPTRFKSLRNNRAAYWHEETGTVVIQNPKALDGGTAF